MAKLSDTDLDAAFAALADPTRRRVLTRLASGPASVTELAADHAMALPSFLAHVRRLEGAGLIVTEKEGRARICRLHPEAFAPVNDWLSDQRALWSERLDRFDDYALTLARERDNEPRS